MGGKITYCPVPTGHGISRLCFNKIIQVIPTTQNTSDCSQRSESSSPFRNVFKWDSDLDLKERIVSEKVTWHFSLDTFLGRRVGWKTRVSFYGMSSDFELRLTSVQKELACLLSPTAEQLALLAWPLLVWENFPTKKSIRSLILLFFFKSTYFVTSWLSSKSVIV